MAYSPKLILILVGLNYSANKKTTTTMKRAIETGQGSLMLALLKGILDPVDENLT